jgi:RNA recognition motif-containing protein
MNTAEHGWYNEHLSKAVCNILTNKEESFTGMREQIDTYNFSKFPSSFIFEQISTHLDKEIDPCIPIM